MSLRVISFLRAVAKGDIVICFNLFRERDREKHILNFKKKHYSGFYVAHLGVCLHRKILGFAHAVLLLGDASGPLSMMTPGDSPQGTS